MDTGATAGEWQVIVGDVLIARGTTAEEALQEAAETARGRDYVVRFIEPPGGTPLPLSDLLSNLWSLLRNSPNPIYLVGGAVRDARLGQASHDHDLAVPSDAIRLTYQLADALHLPAYVMDEERETGRIIVANRGTMIDIARYRGPNLAADLRGRDFTINALALPVGARSAQSIIDLFGGTEDLQQGRIRIIHEQSIADDPVRALRAVRFAHKLGFGMTPETEAAARAAADGLGRISNERIRDELVKLIHTPRPDAAMADLHRLGLLAVTLPEISELDGVEQSAPHFEPVLGHTVRVLGFAAAIEQLLDDPAGTPGDWSPDVARVLAPYRTGLLAHLDRPIDGGLVGRTLLRLAAVWHDVGKRATQQIEPDGRIRFFSHDAEGARLAARRLGRLTLSKEAVDHVRQTVLGHMRPLLFATEGRLPSRRAIYRYYRSFGSAGLDIALLSLADHLATYNGLTAGDEWPQLLAVVDRLLGAYLNEHDRLVAPPRLLSGSELITALDLSPGPEVGRLLRLIEEAQAAGEVATRNDALELAGRMRGREADGLES